MWEGLYYSRFVKAQPVPWEGNPSRDPISRQCSQELQRGSSTSRNLTAGGGSAGCDPAGPGSLLLAEQTRNLFAWPCRDTSECPPGAGSQRARLCPFPLQVLGQSGRAWPQQCPRNPLSSGSGGLGFSSRPILYHDFRSCPILGSGSFSSGPTSVG